MSVYVTKNILAKFNKKRSIVPQETVAWSSSTSSKHFASFINNTLSNSSSNLGKGYICRVCGKSGFTPLLEKFEGSYDIVSALRSVTNLSISLDDTLPKYICSECHTKLQIAVTFKKTCEETDRKFREMINPSGLTTPSYPYSKHDFTQILHKMKIKRLKIEELQEKARQKCKKNDDKRKKLIQAERKGSKQKQFNCSHCILSFPSKDMLVLHRRVSQCSRLTCDICGQLVDNIKHHRRIAHKDVSYSCEVCGREFPFLTRLRAHMMVHTDTFNFFCDLCPYKCKQKYYLVMHMRTHTGEKPYKCPYCDATFVNASNLNKHKLTHQEKRFKCELCEKSFRTNPSLREHHEAAHMNVKHRCGFCGRDFCYRSDLRKHEIRAHNRTKREYIGGEPTYKQVERLQKELSAGETGQKWTHKEIVTGATEHKWTQKELTGETDQKWPPPPPESSAIATEQGMYTAYLNDKQEYVYYTEVPQLPQGTVQQQTVHIATLPDMVTVKKVEGHVNFESSHSMALY